CRLRHGMAACDWTLRRSAPPDSPHRRSVVYFSGKAVGVSAVCRGTALSDLLCVWLCRAELVLCTGMSGGCGLPGSPGRHRQRRACDACGSVHCCPHGSARRPLQYYVLRVLSWRTLGVPPGDAFPALAAACGHAVLG